MELIDTLQTIAVEFANGWHGARKTPKACASRTQCIQQDKAMRDRLTEDQIDLALRESFPASDPLSFY